MIMMVSMDKKNVFEVISRTIMIYTSKSISNVGFLSSLSYFLLRIRSLSLFIRSWKSYCSYVNQWKYCATGCSTFTHTKRTLLYRSWIVNWWCKFITKQMSYLAR